MAVEPVSGLDEVCTAARAVETIEVSEADLADALPTALDGIVVVGTDRHLALAVDALVTSGRDVPVALVPAASSDLLRMFGLERATMLARLETGTPYRADLGLAVIDGIRHPAVAHVVATGGGLARSAQVEIDSGRRDHTVPGWRVVAANAQHLAGATVAPRAALMDGAWDLQVFGGSVLARPRLRRLSRRGLHLKRPEMWRRSLEAAAVRVPSSWRVTADGHGVGRGAFDLAMIPGAYRLWI